jgi:hypothetical protein
MSVVASSELGNGFLNYHIWIDIYLQLTDL